MKNRIIFAMLAAASMSSAKEVYEFNELKVMEPKETRTLDFPVGDAEKRQIRLHLTARFDFKSLSGYTFGMKIFVNGRDVNGVRLLNKPLWFRTRNGGGTYWSRPDGNRWNVMYSPDFSDKIQTDPNYRYGLYEKEQRPYEYVFDLSGLTIHNQNNEITIQPQYSVPVVFKDVRVEIDDDAMPRINEPETEPAPTGILQDFTLKALPVSKAFLLVGKDGAAAPFGLRLRSRFSLPGGKFLQTGDGETDINPAELPYETEFKTPYYTLKRHFADGGGHVRITDTFTNLRDEVTGVRFSNTIELPATTSTVLRGGVAVNMRTVRSPANPTVFAATPEAGIGLVLEDDILRNQAEFSNDEKTIAFSDCNLGLPPKGTHVLEWRVYLLPEADYYDFINSVRRDWDVSFTWNGPQAYPYLGGGPDVWKQIQRWTANPVPQATVMDFLEERPVKILKTHVASDYSVSPRNATRQNPHLGHGTAIPGFTWWCSMTKNMARAFEKYAPDVEVYAYMHKNLCSEPGNRGKYPDSEAIDEASRTLSEREIYMRYVPTVNNSYGKKLAETYRYLVDEVGTHIYMDEISVGVTAWAPYAEWDGCTVEIDPATNEVIRKLSIPNLMQREWLEEMIFFLKSRNRKLLANSPPYTKTLQKHKLMYFVEAGMGEAGLIAAHLSTPLAFDYSRGERGYRHFHNALKSAALALPWSGYWSELCFPFTPLELRSGYLIGEERIVTARSGRFGWNDASEAEVFVFDGIGNPVSGMSNCISENGINLFEIRMPGDHAAIIVKKSALPPPREKRKDNTVNEITSNPFADWRILDGAMRKDSEKYVEPISDGIRLHADGVNVGFFRLEPTKVEPGCKAKITFEASGNAMFNVGVIAYCELPWKKPHPLLQRVDPSENVQRFELIQPINIVGVQGFRPLIMLPSGTKVTVKNFEVAIE